MPEKSATPADSADLSVADALSRARAHWRAGQMDQAEILCQRVLALWPGQADALHLLGLMAHTFGNVDLAIEYLERACRAPRAPASYFSDLAEMCRQRRRLMEAELAARRAVALDGKLAAAWNNLGIILQEAGKLAESLHCLETAVSLRPDFVEGHNNLGNTCKRLGLLERAELHYGQALTLRPQYAEAHSNLANLLAYCGRLEPAAAAASRAVEIDPTLADAYLNLAAIEMLRGRPADALRWLDALLAFAPLHAAGLAARALALQQLDHPEEALDAARRAVATSPESAEAHNALGQVQQSLALCEEALLSFERASALPGPAAETALVNRAALLAETGRRDEAETTFDRAVEKYPRSAMAWQRRADLMALDAESPDLARMEALLGPGGVQSHGDRMLMHFALGNTYLGTGDSDRAFHHLDEGNRMKRSTLRFDPQAAEHWLATIAEVFTPELLTRPDGAGDSTTLPVFIIGMPRSGTRLVERMLGSHPQIRRAGEPSILRRLAKSLESYPAAAERLTAEHLARMGGDYAAFAARLAGGKSRVVDRSPANFAYAGLIRLILPESRIIHCRRDPVDTCLSCYRALFSADQPFTYDLAELGRFYRAYQALMEHWRRVLPADRFIEVDYETILDDADREARRLVAFLGLPWADGGSRLEESLGSMRGDEVDRARHPAHASLEGQSSARAARLAPLLEALGAVTP